MKKTRSLFLALALCLTMATGAMASIIYGGYPAGDYKNFTIGTITGSKDITPEAITGLAGVGQELFAFTNANGERRLLVVEESSTAGTYDKGLIYNYNKSDWSKTPVANEALTNLNCCRGAAQAGNYIYLAGYGSSAANGSVIKVSTENDKYTVVASQDFSSVSEKSKFLHAETIAAYGGYIYVVASKVNSSYTYDNNILFKLNAGDLSIVKQSTLTTKNRDGQNAYILSGSSLYITADPYGTPCIEKINLSDMTSKTLISGSINSDGYAYNSLLLVGSTVYVSTSKYNWIAGCSDYKLYETTLANLEAGKLTSDDEISSSTNGLYGSAWLAYDTESHLVWAQQGALCSYDGEDFAFYSDSSTKNVPSKFICVESLGSNPNSGGSGSGGCNAGFGALLLLAAVPALTFTRKKK